MIFAIVTLFPILTYSQPTNIPVNTSGNQRETAITVDPNDPDHLMATWNDFSISSPPYRPGYAFSTDGGKTWSTDTFDDEGFDPSCGIDNSGRAYYTYVNSGAVQISYTTDDGDNWIHQQVSSSSQNQDKPYMAVDTTGGTYDGRLYVAWVDFLSSNNNIVFAYSTNQGSTWTQQTIQSNTISSLKPEMLLKPFSSKTSASSSSRLLQSPEPVVGPNGNVYIVYQDISDYYTSGSSTTIKFTKSTNGGQSFSAPATIANIYGIWSEWVGWLRVSSYPTIAVDPSSGNIYVAYTQYDNGDNNIYYIRSTNNGSSWSSPSIATQSTSSMQIFPWLTVNSSGVVSLVYYQGNEDAVDVYMAESYNNGQSFSGNDTRITPSSQDPNAGSWSCDYIGAISTASGKTLPCWTDFRIGTTARTYTTPYYYSGGNITQNLTIPGGKSVIFAPGSQTKFTSNTQLTVNGKINAVGTTANPVIFTSANVSPSAGDWQGIRFTNGNNGSVLDYCEICYATNGVCVDNTNIDVKHSYIHHNSYSGLLELNGSDIFLQYNTIANAYYGLACRYDVEALLGKYNTRGGNRIHNHWVGVECSYDSYMMLGRPDWYPAKNSVYDIGGTYLAEALFGGDILALITWWGTPNPPSYRFLYSGYGGTIDHSMPLSSDPGYGSPLEKAGQSEQITDTSPPIIDPNDPESLYKAGDYYRWTNESDKAVEIWKQLIENFKESKYAVKALVQLYHLSKDCEINDFSLYLKNIRIGEKIPAAFYRKAMILETYLCLSKGKNDAALSLAQEMTSNRHKDTQAELYGLYTLAMSNDKCSQDALNTLKECYPNNALTNIASEQHNETTVWSDKTIGESLDKGKGDYIEGEKILPGKFALYENYPNPFNPTTTIKYDLPEDVNVTVTIYNNNGQKVKELVNGFKPAGSYTVTFDGKSLASGMYFYKIEAGEFSKVKRMLLVK